MVVNASAMEKEYCLELSENPIRFEGVNQLTNVFFDDSNKHVFVVRSGGVMGVVVKGAAEEEPFTFRMDDRGTVLSIKFSLDKRILAIQRTGASVEFMGFAGGALDPIEFSQHCKKSASILGFVWLPGNEVALITDHGVELFLVVPEKKAVKYLRASSIPVQWFVWCPQNRMALLASAHGSQLQPVLFKPGAINKYPKVETESGRMALERDVTLSTLYDVPAVLILRHQSGPQCAEVHVHLLNGPGHTPVKSHVLKLGLSGRFAINIVDNLVLVHHQASRSTQIFDTNLSGDSDGSVKYHTTVAPANSFKPVQIAFHGLLDSQTLTCELYSPNWVVFQPNIVIDAKLGCLWHIEIRLLELCKSISDLSVCTQVALKRAGGKPVLIQLLLAAVQEPKPNLRKIRECFGLINSAYRDWVEAEVQNKTALPVGASGASAAYPHKTPPKVIVDQCDFFNEIFLKLDFDTELDKLEWLLTSYVTSLLEQGVNADHDINELIIAVLIKNEKFSTLQQLLQYGALADSKPLACLLLSMGNINAAATQLALDMLARLNATEEIQEILLNQGQISAALQLIGPNANPLKFLQATQQVDDKVLFHSILYFFKNAPHLANAFKKDERLKHFLQQYESTFPEVEAADRQQGNEEHDQQAST